MISCGINDIIRLNSLVSQKSFPSLTNASSYGFGHKISVPNWPVCICNFSFLVFGLYIQCKNETADSIQRGETDYRMNISEGS